MRKIFPAMICSLAAILWLSLPSSGQETVSAGGFTILGKFNGKVQSQNMGAFGGKWQDGDQLWWTGAKPGDRLRLIIPIQEEGIYQISAVLTRARDYAVVQLSLDGKKVGGPVDLYNPEVVPTEAITLGTHKLTKGNHSLEVTIVGANPRAIKAYMVGVDYLVFRPAKGPQAAIFTYPKSLYPYVSLTPEAAAKAMRLPKGFSVQLAAAEPDVKQPIAMAIDDRGRLWVAEAYEYPRRAPEGKGRDRILIFEDTDGDGKFDKRTVFIEGLNLVSGLEVGFGGVWVGAAPYLLFIPIKEGEDRPAGPPQILLDGWGYHDTHETLNTFIWGPDGWLYGCHGVFTHSRVGKPGTPDAQRIPLNAAIWRYHPVRHQFEVFAHGTSNPWGADFDDHGQAFCTACVIPHLYHIVQGGRYQRQAGLHFNPFTYADIQTIADHLHYLGNQWNNADRRGSNDLGGGHAHAGAMVYLGGSWPAKYRNQIFMNNIHGNRINMDWLKPKGSGFVGNHGPDFILTDDQSSQILNLRYGPDGQVWMIDWYDRNQCHHGNVAGHDRSNGRIFRVTYHNAKPIKVDLRKLNERDLIRLQFHENDWYVRHARRLLQERAASATFKSPSTNLHVELIKIIQDHPDETRRLRALWALHALGRLIDPFAEQFLANDRPYVRAWTIQLLLENRKQLPAKILHQFAGMAHKDSSPVVRLYLASALQRLPLEQRWPILEGLVGHPEDAVDHNLPLMYWYAMEPLAGRDASRALALGLVAGENIPLLRNFMIRRIGSGSADKSLALLIEGLERAKESGGRQLAFLRGIRQALAGRRQVSAPEGWKGVYVRLAQSPNEKVRFQAQALAVTFGDKKAASAFTKFIKDASADIDVRKQALSALLQAGIADLAPVLHGLVTDPALRMEALRGLAGYADSHTPEVILGIYGKLPLAEKRVALATLCSRLDFAQALLTAIQKKQVPASDVTADLARQLRALKNPSLDQRLAEVWGKVGESSADLAKRMAEFKNFLRSPAKKTPDPSLGRALFAKTCQQCHTLYGQGGKVGPDITGANRSDLDYLLSNIIDPSAVMAKEYQPSVIVTSTGRLITGIVKDQSADALTLLTTTETIVLPRKEIDSIQQSKQSMMPNDLLKPLHEHEVRSLFAYLSGRQQAPLLATPDNVAGFFNGRDLSGWNGAGPWQAIKGEIVSAGSTEARPAFLISDFVAADFHLSLEVNPGKQGQGAIIFRGQRPDRLAREPRLEFAAVKRPALILSDGKSSNQEGAVQADSWNQVEIIAEGQRIRVRLNGQESVSLEHARLPGRGFIALLHLGKGVRFRKLQLKLFQKGRNNCNSNHLQPY